MLWHLSSGAAERFSQVNGVPQSGREGNPRYIKFRRRTNMTLYRFKKPSILVAICLIFVMALAVACGSADAPAAAPAAPAAPAASGSSAAPAAAAAPTAKPKPTEVALGGGETMISFADFWQPPTAIYGEPTSGGHLRIIYEDPLDHGNVWGAASGVTDRYRGPTMNTLIQEIGRASCRERV